MSSGAGQDDRHESLRAISSRGPWPSAIAQLLEIQEHKMPEDKSVPFVRNLECLFFSDSDDGGLPVLRRRRIDAMNNRHYVVLSYTWDPSKPYEDDEPRGSYRVQNRCSDEMKRSCRVRDRVFERMRRYMDYVKCPSLWIDAYCVEQENEKENQRGMNAMDLVYSKSDYPVALLARPIRSLDELRLLVCILEGRFVLDTDRGFVLSGEAPPAEVLQAVQLLWDITRDLWWTRGWTYQENYKAKRMVLLIPHVPELENEKPYKLLGSLIGELCVESVKFHEEATKLVLACQGHPLIPGRLLKGIIERAPRYQILLGTAKDGGTPTSKTMTPSILAGVTARGLKEPWDCLAIVANCCQYSTRLNSDGLKKGGYSLSLSILALHLLNGEIMSNDLDEEVSAEERSNVNIVDFIQRQAFRYFKLPLSVPRQLTFYKSCRFAQVDFAREGIYAAGYLWEIYKPLRTVSLQDKRPPQTIPQQGSVEELARQWRRWRLGQLAEMLHIQRHDEVVAELDRFLDWDEPVSGYNKTFARTWQETMALSVADAIDKGLTLGLAELVGDRGRHPETCAIFVIENENDEEALSRGLPVYAFTATRPEKEGTPSSYPNDVERHASLVVGSPDLQAPSGRQLLYSKHWINGLCFFYGRRQQDVVFAWPSSLQALRAGA